MTDLTNQQFMTAIFGADAPWAHVTDFPDDPADITDDRRMICWAGDYNSRYSIRPDTNQYYTISTFFADDTGKARRRKALYRATHVIVADDVREKLPEENVLRLPPPSFKLQTSPGSEQWGWILDQPATDRHRIENLLDGLVAQGLAPEGKDPGMKGVTRYVRLPEGVNTKSSKLVDGVAQKCVMLEWHPDRRVSLEDLATPFSVDLDAARREQCIDGAADVADHPLLQLSELINIKEIRSDGRFDITCPWVEDHTGAADDGAAVFTNKDGSIGFKCHHGTCQERTGRDLLDHIESHDSHSSFRHDLKSWQVLRSFAEIASPTADSTEASQSIDFLGSHSAGEVNPPITPQPDQMVGYQTLIDHLNKEPRTSPKALEMAKAILKTVDSLGYADRLVWWELVREHMAWTKPDLNKIIDDLRREWYKSEKDDGDFYDDCVFVSGLNQFFNPSKRMFLSVEGYQNTYGHLDDEARSEALINGRVKKVDRLDYAPGMPEIFTEDNITFANAWCEHHEVSVPGDVQRWLDHFTKLGWGEHRKHILQWMAFTIRHPERKINHALLLGGGEGNGKDFLLYPLIRAMHRDCTTINGDELLRDFNEYLMSTKYLHINEAELGDRQEARAITNKLKPLTTAPPLTIPVNPKGTKGFDIRNIVNVTITTNSAVPLKLDDGARRYYAIWTDVTIRNERGEMTDDWREYWTDRWAWMRDCEGWRACLHYLHHSVDLSDFDAGSVPIMTEFVREIQEASEDPIVTMIKKLRDDRLGNFQSDLLTSADIAATLHASSMLLPDMVMHQRLPSANVVGKIMKQAGLGVYRRIRSTSLDCKVWVIRDADQYEGLASSELAAKYSVQIKMVKDVTAVKIVKDTTPVKIVR